MKNYTYYDAYHRPRKVPGYFFQKCFGGKSGIFLVSFFIAIILEKYFCGMRLANMEVIT